MYINYLSSSPESQSLADCASSSSLTNSESALLCLDPVCMGRVEFDSEQLIVQVCSVVFLNGFLCVLLPLVKYGGTPEKLSELVSIESAFLELSDLLKEFLFASLALSSIAP